MVERGRERELMYCFYKAQSQGPGYINRLFTLFKDRNPSNPIKPGTENNKTKSNISRTSEPYKR